MALKVTGGLPYKVVIVDDNGNMAGGSSIAPVIVSAPTSVSVAYNITLTAADTEYAQVLPVPCRMFEFQARTEATVRWSEIAGRVATPVAPYRALKAGDYYYSPQLNRTAPSTLYFASPTAGTIVELIVWY